MPGGRADRLVIWGAAGHAAVVADAARASGRHEVAGFLDDVHPDVGRAFCGATILGGRDRLQALHADGLRHVIFGFGDCQARLEVAAMIQAAGFEAATVVHPRSVVAHDVELGKGTFVAAGAVINAGARIGRHAIVNTLASVDHDCQIGDAAHICPGVRLAGGVIVGRGAWVGIGSTVVQGVRIGEGAVIGAGSVVLRDLPSGVLSYGVPARVIRHLNGECNE